MREEKDGRGKMEALSYTELRGKMGATEAYN